MNKNIASTVRAVFALFLMGLGMYASIDSLVAKELANRGLSTCGQIDNPCALSPLTVTAPRPSGKLVTSPAANVASLNTLGTAASATAHPNAMAES